MRSSGLSVPPRFGLQLNSLIDVNVYGVSWNSEYVFGSHFSTPPCFSLTTIRRRGLLGVPLVLRRHDVAERLRLQLAPGSSVSRRGPSPASSSACFRSLGWT